MKIFIQNCEDPTLVFGVGYEGSQTEFPFVTNFGTTSISYVTEVDSETELCLYGVSIVFDDLDPDIQDLTLTVQGEFNGKPYYYTPLTYEGDDHQVYVLWNNDRWEMWYDFDGTDFGCSAPFCTGCNEDEPFMFLEEEDITQGTWQWAGEGALCNFYSVRAIESADLCPAPATIEIEATDCWTAIESATGLVVLGEIADAFLTDQQLYVDCEECLEALERQYLIFTNCQDEEIRYYTDDPSIVLGYQVGDVYIITLGEEAGCYSISEAASPGDIEELPETAEIGTEQVSCDTCIQAILPDYLIYTNCEDDDDKFYQEEFSEEDVDKVFQLQQDDDVVCYHTTVSKEIEGINELPEETEFSGSFNTCNGCLPTHIECESKLLYTLIPCQGEGNVLVDDDSLEDLVGEYIRIPFLDNRCFRVTEQTSSENPNYYSPLPYEGPFTDCFDCYPKMEVEPTLPERCCSAEKVEKAFCSFVDIMYRKMISERYGVKSIQKEDKFDMTLAKYKSVSNQLLCSDIPLLRIPKPTLCCIELEKVCVVHQSNCFSCEEKTTEKIKPAEDCLCEIADQEYECHEYSIRVTELRLSTATGNDDTNLNGRVFFSYYPCGSLKAKTKTYKRSGEDTFCVVGQPLFGYFKDNEFVEINTTQGDECESAAGSCCQ